MKSIFKGMTIIVLAIGVLLTGSLSPKTLETNINLELNLNHVNKIRIQTLKQTQGKVLEWHELAEDRMCRAS